MNTPLYLDEHRRPEGSAGSPAASARPAGRVNGLRIDTDGRLSEVLIPGADPWSAMRTHVGARPDPGGVGVEALDADLAMWFDENGAEPDHHARHNPTASVAAAMFGRPGPISGPVVFTGCTPALPGRPVGDVRDVSVAATLLLAGIAPTCHPHASAVDRAADFARLGIDIVAAPRTAAEPTGEQPDPHRAGSRRGSPSDDPEVSYDAQAHTVTVDGALPRCAECDNARQLHRMRAEHEEARSTSGCCGPPVFCGQVAVLAGLARSGDDLERSFRPPDPLTVPPLVTLVVDDEGTTLRA